MAQNNFKKFLFSETPSKYSSATGVQDGDIAFVGGTAKTNASSASANIPSASGIYTQGYYYPTPYTKETLDAKEAALGVRITNNTNNITSISGRVDVLEGTAASLDTNYAKRDLSNVDNYQNIVYKGSDGKIAASLLPSYVDDVKEISTYMMQIGTVTPGTVQITSSSQIVYASVNGGFFAKSNGAYYATWTAAAGDPTLEMASYGTVESGVVKPVTDKIYIILDDNRVYRWSGSAFVEISSCAISDSQATTLLNEYIKTVADGTVTEVTSHEEITVVTGAGTKTNSTTKTGATQTLALSKAATKTYVDKMSPTVTEDATRDTDTTNTDFVWGVSNTKGSISTQADIQYMIGSFRPLAVTVNGESKASYTPNKATTLALNTSDFISWTIL